MKMCKKVVSVVLAVFMLITVFPAVSVSAGNTVVSGACGDNVNWSLDLFSGKLTISGTGPMSNFEDDASPWQEHEKSIFSVVIQDGVTSIGESSFNSCYRLTDIDIPDSVVTIGQGAFSNCSRLTKISLPDTITSIGASAFHYCLDLTEITIPNGVTKIEVGTFSSCKGLTKITIPNSVTNIEWSAFHACHSLTSVVIPDGVTSIGQQTFDGCSSLTDVFIPDSVTSIGTFAFANCTSLKEIDIPDSVAEIGMAAFNNCTELKKIVIPNSVTVIGKNSGHPATEGIFANCTSLTEIVVMPGNTKYASQDGVLFDNDKTDLIAYPAGKTGAYVIPDTVERIFYAAFSGCSGLTSVTIPKNMYHVERGVFSDCVNLSAIEVAEENKFYTSYDGVLYNDGLSMLRMCPEGKTGVYTLPESADYIEIGAFSNCIGLTGINFGTKVRTISDQAFENCTGLTEITLPESVTRLGEEAFAGCTGLTNVKLSGNIDDIRESAFSDCTNLVSVTIPNGVTSIEERAFYNCHKLTDLRLPDSVNEIGKNAFRNCVLLTDVTLPDRLIKMGDYVFEGCGNLTNVTIPDSVVEIGKNILLSCQKNPTISGYAGSLAEDYAAKNGIEFVPITDTDKLTTSYGLEYIIDRNNVIITGYSGSNAVLVIPSEIDGMKVTAIAEYAFWRCTHITNVHIPPSVKNIGECAVGYVYDYTYGGYDRLNNLTITGYRGSVTETYAKSNGFDFYSTGRFVDYGNVDGENGATASDALIVLQVATGRVLLTDEQTEKANVDGVGGITTNDALLILQYATQKIYTFPAEA